MLRAAWAWSTTCCVPIPARYIEEYRAEQARLVEQFKQRQAVSLVPLKEARANAFVTDWARLPIDTPTFLGPRTLESVPLAELVDFIDWSPFFHAWEFGGRYPALLDDPVKGEAARRLFADAQPVLRDLVENRRLTARAAYGFWPANSEGDDIIVYTDESRTTEATRFCMLRQQWERKEIGSSTPSQTSLPPSEVDAKTTSGRSE